MLDKLDVSRRPTRQEISDRVIEPWIAYQTELHAHGVNAHARRLDRQIWQAMVTVPGIDADPGEELHLFAYPARSRRPRLVRGDASAP